MCSEFPIADVCAPTFMVTNAMMTVTAGAPLSFLSFPRVVWLPCLPARPPARPPTYLGTSHKCVILHYDPPGIWESATNGRKRALTSLTAASLCSSVRHGSLPHRKACAPQRLQSRCGKLPSFLRNLIVKTIDLPRQARDKHTGKAENEKKRRFLAGLDDADAH